MHGTKYDNAGQPVDLHFPQKGPDGKVGCAWPGCSKRVQEPFRRRWYFYPSPTGPGDFGCRKHAVALLKERMGAVVRNNEGETEYIVYTGEGTQIT